MKKLCVLALAIMMMLCACSSLADYTPGTYTGEADGRNDKVAVEVVVDENSIVSVTVTQQQETVGICEPALERIPQAIVDEQSLAIDAVAGCTVTSEAILAAAEQALTAAGGDMAALKTPVEKEAVVKETVTYDTDVVIVGCGGAGANAGVAAIKAGASVIILDKMANIGGNTAASGGSMNAANPDLQRNFTMTENEMAEIKEILATEPVDEYMARWQEKVAADIAEYEANGETYLYDSPELHMLQTYMGGDYVGNPIMIETLCSNVTDSIQWLSDLGAEWMDEAMMAIGAKWRRTNQSNFNWGPLGTNMYLPSATWVKENGGQIFTEHKVDTILMDGGRAIGVSGVTSDGQPFVVNASKGVIIATGGFSASIEMRQKYNKHWPSLDEQVNTTNMPHATGDGIVMAEAAGANLVGMEWIQLLTQGYQIFTSSIINDIYVNNNGERFVREDGRRDELAMGVLSQPGKTFWQITDGHTTVDILNNLAEGGEQIPDMVDDKYIFCADTLEELAGKIGVDPATFVAAVDTFNASVDGAEDPYGRKLFQYKLDKAPFYAIYSEAMVHHTMGGIEINPDAQVLDTNGNVIPGLYAAGEVTGGIHGSNRLGGNALADIVTFGRIAGTNAANMK